MSVSTIASGSLGGLTSLIRWSIEDGHFNGFPSDIGSMVSLQELYLADNDMLVTLPDTMAACTSLQVVDLQRATALTRLPDAICSWSALITFILVGTTNLAYFPDCFGRNQGALTSLTITGAIFVSIPLHTHISMSTNLIDVCHRPHYQMT
jgi:hypothetical protein